MSLLLDTHVLLWWLNGSRELSRKAVELISDPEHAVFVSAVSVWEIRIKEALGKIALPRNFLEALREEGFEPLAVTWDHAEAVSGLPKLHGDPIDRMLLAQAQREGLTLVTRDRALERYGVEVEIV